MSIILVLILVSLVMALIFLSGFIWAVRSGQFEDSLTPSMRILFDEKLPLDKLEPESKTLRIPSILPQPGNAPIEK